MGSKGIEPLIDWSGASYHTTRPRPRGCGFIVLWSVVTYDWLQTKKIPIFIKICDFLPSFIKSKGAISRNSSAKFSPLSCLRKSQRRRLLLDPKASVSYSIPVRTHPTVKTLVSQAKNKSADKCEEANWTLLLERFYGEYYTPVFWEEEKKSKNFFATIGRGTKYLFKRDFLRRHYIDDCVVFKKKDFKENTIVEQRCTYVHGSKEEITFQGFFVIHHKENGIYGEEISQKQALEYFYCVEILPENT